MSVSKVQNQGVAAAATARMGEGRAVASRDTEIAPVTFSAGVKSEEERLRYEDPQSAQHFAKQGQDGKPRNPASIFPRALVDHMDTILEARSAKGAELSFTAMLLKGIGIYQRNLGITEGPRTTGLEINLAL